MKEYILINRVPENYDRTEAQKINEAWNIVTNKWKEDEIFIYSFVFPNKGYEIAESDRVVNNGYVLTNKLKVVSVIVIKANDLESAVELAKACPILDQAGTIEVREIMERRFL